MERIALALCGTIATAFAVAALFFLSLVAEKALGADFHETPGSSVPSDAVDAVQPSTFVFADLDASSDPHAALDVSACSRVTVAVLCDPGDDSDVSCAVVSRRCPAGTESPDAACRVDPLLDFSNAWRDESNGDSSAGSDVNPIDPTPGLLVTATSGTPRVMAECR